MGLWNGEPMKAGFKEVATVVDDVSIVMGFGAQILSRSTAGDTRGIPIFWAVQNRINYDHGECHVSYSILLNVKVQVSGCPECQQKLHILNGVWRPLERHGQFS